MKASVSYSVLFAEVRAYWRTLGFALACTVVYVLSMPGIAVLMGRAAQYVGDRNVQALLHLPLSVGLFFVIRGVFEYAQDVLMAQVAFNITLGLRRRVYANLLRMEVSFFQQSATGDLTYRLTEDIDRIGEILNQLFHQSIPCAFQLMAVLAYMVYLNGLLTLVSLVLAPLVALVIGWFGDRLLVFARCRQGRVSNLAALLTEAFGSMELVKAYGTEAYEMERFMRVANRNRDATLAVERVKAIQYPFVGMIEAIAISILFLFGGWQISLGALTASQFISFVAAVILLIDPINLITENYNKFKQGQASIDRIQELLSLQTESESPHASPLPPIQGALQVQQVGFAYSPDQPVLQNLSFQVHPGEAVALIGPSGAGKSTLAHLLLCLYRPHTGRILIDGIDSQTITRHSWCQHIGIVSQHTYLFSGTIAENIAYGQQAFDMQKVREAAEVANALDFIQNLPQGFHTYLGEQGTTLSGGQRQRLAIARAIFRKPRLLILDEATSALDVESETLIQAALQTLRDQGRRSKAGRQSLLIIAHRYTSLRHADRILVMEKGQIVESGTHTQLLKDRCSSYARLYAQQLLKADASPA